MKTRLALLGAWVMAGWAAVAHAQGSQQVTFNPAQPIPLVTTGSVTYAEYTWVMGGCLSVSNIGPLVLHGADFSLDFDIQMETGVACPEDVFMESAAVVLGALAPGPYTLTTTSWGTPVATNTFIVPTNSTPMIEPVGFASDGSFQMQLNGIASVDYVLQCSTNLANWTALSTNSAGSPLTDASPVLSGPRFYRVQIPRTVNLR